MVTRLDDNPLTKSADSSKHEEKHEPEVNPEPEHSSSDLSETYSSDSRANKKKHKKKKIVVSIGKMTLQNHLRATTLILPMKVIIGASDAKIRNIGKIIRSKNAQF